MSLILDALRKSEAERCRGQLPALTLELPPTPARHTPSRAWWLAVPVVLLVAAAAYVSTRPPADNAPVVATQSAEIPAAATAPAEAVPPATEVGAGAAAGGFERAIDGTRPALAAGRGRVPANPPAVAPAPPPEAEAPAIDAPEPDPAQATPRVLALGDLTTSERQALPPLKLSMHMWSADPARRFAIVDGQRLVEGDRIGSAVVERIEPDGVVLATDGRLVRVPLP